MGSIITGWWLCILQTGWKIHLYLCVWTSLTNFQVFSETTDTFRGQVLFPLSFWKYAHFKKHIACVSYSFTGKYSKSCTAGVRLSPKLIEPFFEVVLQKQEVTIHQTSSKFELERSWIRFKHLNPEIWAGSKSGHWWVPWFLIIFFSSSVLVCACVCVFVYTVPTLHAL